jgi:DNA end-binding protein Ku
MAARSTWKGSLRLSLISIPIRVFPATNPGSDVSFRQFHRKCHTPIKMKRWCPHCEEEVALDDIVKGYETAKGRSVMVEPEDIAKLRPESTRTVEITHVLEGGAIDPLYIERAYFLAPDNKAAGSSFAVLRDALEGRAAIGRLALHGREYLAAVVPRAPELLLYTLRTAGEVRNAGDIEELRFAATKVKADELKLARQVLNSVERVSDLSAFTDHYEDALKDMLSRKHVEVVAEPGAAKVKAPANLMEALRKSLAQVAARPHRHTRRAS